MPDRSRLYGLVDTLPESTLALAQGTPEQLQAWRPQESRSVRELREQQLAWMSGSIQPGTTGGGGYQTGQGGRPQYGHQWYSYWEAGAAVVVTHRFHAGHGFVIEERFRLVDAAHLAYSHEIAGPGGSINRYEITVSVGPK